MHHRDTVTGQAGPLGTPMYRLEAFVSHWGAVTRGTIYALLAYFPKMPANFVPHFLMIQASSELIRPGTCLVYSWKELPAGFWRLNVTMTRDRIFSLKSALFFAGR